MNAKTTIRKIIFISMWMLIGAGMITLLAAAIRKQKTERCSGYNIRIKGASSNLFADEKDILRLMTAGTNGKIKNQPRSAFDLRRMEQQLENNIWIKDAELYFDNNNLLQVTVTERLPIARIFTTTGKSFYIDSEEKRIPLSEKLITQLPVFTGFPDKKLLAPRDSVLLHQVRVAAEFIQSDPLWSAQVSQIDITADREFEMLPVVGNHTVKFGTGDDIDRKFNRLFLFYKNILSKTGFDKYQTIDVQYEGQVIGTKGSISKVDSIQLRKNVEKLLQQSREMQNDTTNLVATRIASPGIEARTEIIKQIEEPNSTLSRVSNPHPLKLSQSSKPEEKPGTNNPTPVKREPKAVMGPHLTSPKERN